MLKFSMNNSNNRFALIMAGGQGTRFWPYSTLEEPKQFLKIIGKDSLILQTFKRLEKIIPKENIFVVAHNRYLNSVIDAVPGFKKSNFIDEPIAKNTAPCLILSNIFLSGIDQNAKLLVVPADHYIPDSQAFAEQMKNAFELADKKNIITFGITPNSPHTGYGYIKFDKTKKESINTSDFYTAMEFKEKPDKTTAQKYLDDKTYLWNSGMFVYKLDNFKLFLKKYSDYYYKEYLNLESSYENKENFYNIFNNIKPESIDYALMERVKELKISPVEFEWNDVGSWSSVYDLKEKDDKGNANLGKNAMLDTLNSMAFSTEDKPIAIIGLDNVVVINTKHGILVSHIDKLQQVKQVQDLLKKK